MPQPLALSLFSGCGGLDLGIEAAGWRTICQIEMHPDCVQTLRGAWGSRPHRPLLLETKVEDVSPARLRRELELRRGELSLLVGGPPCQPFTTHGLRQGIQDSRAASSFPAYLEFLEEFRPASLVFENVDGLLSAALRHRPVAERGPEHPPLAPDERKGSFLKWLLDELAALGYSVSWGVLEAADFGVPQLRQRAFLVGVHDCDACYLPARTFGTTSRPYRTLKDALGDLNNPGPIQPLSAAKRAVYRQVPPGGNWRDLPQHIQQQTMGRAYEATGGKSGWWRRLSWDHPSPTILGMPDHSSTGLIHPDEVRCLGLNECAAIQTFPRAFRFAGTPRSGYQQIGNAVPPLLARAVGHTLAKHLAGVRRKTPAPPPWRRASANRRIGTHGWVVPSVPCPEYSVVAKPRADHIWCHVERETIYAR